MSKLRRDRHALRVARYVRRCETLTGVEYTGPGRWGMASYRALKWLHDRKANMDWTPETAVRAERRDTAVNRLFYVEL